MLRVYLELVGVFLLPFLLFGLYRLVRSDDKEKADAERFRPYAWLALVGLVLVIAFQLYGALNTERGKGTYHPARMEGGVLVPGRVE
jgi:Family of unknown function (DUF6111)